MSSSGVLKSAAFEQFGLNLQNTWYVLKNSWFMPESFYSFIVFCVLMTLIFILVIFFHHNNIQRQVKKYSRCYRNKMKKQVSGLYTVTATTGQPNQQLYSVTYDLAKKQSTVQCACPQGEDATVANVFRNIPVYNMQTKQVDTIQEKYCHCKFQADSPSASVYFTGHPGLVRFMNSKDDSFFTA